MKPVWRLLRLISPVRGWFFVAVGLSFFTVVFGIALMATSGYLISRAALATEIASISIAITGVRLFAIGRAGSRYLERLTSHIFTFEILTQLRSWFYSAVEPLAPARLTSHRTGDLVSRSVADIETIESFYVRGVIPPIAAAGVAIFASGLLALFDPWLGVCLAVFLLLGGVLVPVSIQRLAASTGSELVSARAELHARLIDGVQGRADILMFDSANMHDGATAAARSRLLLAQHQFGVIRGLGLALGSLAVAGTVVVLLVIAIPMVTNGQLDGVYLALVVMASIASFEAMQPLAPALQQLEATRTAVRRIFDVIDAPPPLLEPEAPLPTPASFSINVQGLSFTYEGANHPALRNLSFDVPAGTNLGIVGPSGAGKSTIANLLVRFWDYSHGSIKVGGHELRECNANDVRALIAVVPQDIHLFNTTLRDNLLVANPDATDDDLNRVLHIAMLDGFVLQLPAGLNTQVGENGLLLSGGERQRIGVARALLKDAPIMILDEPTANLDPSTSKSLMTMLQTVLAGRTVITISHRPDTFVGAHATLDLERCPA